MRPLITAYLYGLGAGFFLCAGLVEYLQGSYFPVFAFWLLAAVLSTGVLQEFRKSKPDGRDNDD